MTLSFELLAVVVILAAFGLALSAYALAANFPDAAWRIRWLLDPIPRAHVEYARGYPDTALRRLEGPPSGELDDLNLLNTRVALKTAAGRYRAALADGPTRYLWRRLRRKYPPSAMLVVLNKVEALYNLGQWRRAERVMLMVCESGAMSVPFLQVGAACQLAWILAHTGRAAVAEELVRSLPAEHMNRVYRAEVFFTRAVIALELGKLDDAAQALDGARAVLVRESSRRNCRFLEARLLEARGQLDAAFAASAEAAEMPFKGQGGPELRRWAALATRLGRFDDAARIERLALERDPESPAVGAKGTGRDALSSSA